MSDGLNGDRQQLDLASHPQLYTIEYLGNLQTSR
jgi:hypothetical protein